MRKYAFTLLITLLIGLVSACRSSENSETTAGDAERTSTAERTDADTGGTDNFLRDGDAINEAFEALRELDRFKGKPVKLMGGIRFYGDGRIGFDAIQDPDKPENVDAYDYVAGKWQDPVPVKLRGDGKLEDNLINLDAIKGISKIPDMMRAIDDKTKGMKLDKPVDYIYYAYDARLGTSVFSTSVDDERAEYDVNFTSDGVLKDWFKR